MFFGRRRKNCGEGLFSPEFKLGWAVVRGDLAEVKRLVIDCGVNPNIQDANGRTPLHYAAFDGRLEVVKLLLEHGADPNIKNNDGDTPLHIAARRDYCVVVKLLLNHGADPTIRNKKGRTPRDYGSNCRGLIEELRRGGTRTTVYE
jgi:ankyrin repeat protein